MELFLTPLIIVGVVAGFIWLTYNGLVTAKTRIEEAWSDISVQLKRRADLIPNLLETVKGYAKHEKEVFENVTAARAALMGAKTPGETAQAENVLTSALKSLFAVAEAYPELKASQNFGQLQDELKDTEDKIAYSRRFYNQNVLDYNTKIRVFPAVLIANTLGFKEAEFFKTDEKNEEPVKINF